MDGLTIVYFHQKWLNNNIGPMDDVLNEETVTDLAKKNGINSWTSEYTVSEAGHFAVVRTNTMTLQDNGQLSDVQAYVETGDCDSVPIMQFQGNTIHSWNNFLEDNGGPILDQDGNGVVTLTRDTLFIIKSSGVGAGITLGSNIDDETQNYFHGLSGQELFLAARYRYDPVSRACFEETLPPPAEMIDRSVVEAQKAPQMDDVPVTTDQGEGSSTTFTTPVVGPR